MFMRLDRPRPVRVLHVEGYCLASHPSEQFHQPPMREVYPVAGADYAGGIWQDLLNITMSLPPSPNLPSLPGSSCDKVFNERHVLAISQAICL
jgi:hypothetical protein